MSTKKMDRKARRYLLTGRTDSAADWDVYGLQSRPNHPQGREDVRFFMLEQDRRKWIAESPTRRMAVGKRHPAVRAFRDAERIKAQEERHERARQKDRDAAYTTWMWEST